MENIGKFDYTELTTSVPQEISKKVGYSERYNICNVHN